MLVLSLTFFHETPELLIYLIFEYGVTIVEFFIVPHKDDLVAPLNIVEHSASVHNSDVRVLSLLVLGNFIYIVSSRGVLKPQGALGRRKLLVDVLILMNVVEADERKQVGEVVGYDEVDEVGRYCCCDYKRPS
jgi:hypothetical protein